MKFSARLRCLRLLTFTWVLLLPATAAPSDQPNSPSQRNKPYVLLIGLDGFRDDYAERFHAVNLLALQQRGSSSKRLIPAFPSVTFPNFHSIATGLQPERHGLVGMLFYDPARHSEFDFRLPISHDSAWYGGTPIWVLGERQGMRTACYFWVGSDVEIQGIRPARYVPYNTTATHQDRVRQVVEWFKLPVERRPHLVMLYFSDVDHAGHEFGPESPEVAAAVQAVDTTLGILLQELRALRPQVNVIVVSDHGMDTVGKIIDVGKDTDFPGMHIVNQQTQVALYGTDTIVIEQTRQKLIRPNSEFKVYRRSELPAHLHYSSNPRIGDLVILPDGRDWVRIAMAGQEPHPAPKGWHGWDPAKVPTMHGIFYAAGPQIRAGLRLPPVANDAIYPLLTTLLGLTPPVDQPLNPELLGILKKTRLQ